MATIIKRNGKYLARVRQKGIDTSSTFRTLAEAKAWAAQTETDINNRKHGITPKHLLFADLINRYLTEVTPSKRGAKKETIRLQFLLRQKISKIPAADLMPHHIAEYRDTRLKTIQPSSVSRELTAISSILDHAMREWNLINDNPARKVSRPNSAPPRTRRPTEDETRRICLYLEYDDDTPPKLKKQRTALAWLLAIETAMRAGEICGIEWQHIDLNRRIVHLPQTKNGSSRDVPLSRRAIALIEKLKPLNLNKPFDMTADTLSTLFRRACRACEIEDLHFHDSRREALTRMSKKVNVMDLAKISGHKDVRILLNTYYAPDASALADLLD